MRNQIPMVLLGSLCWIGPPACVSADGGSRQSAWSAPDDSARRGQRWSSDRTAMATVEGASVSDAAEPDAPVAVPPGEGGCERVAHIGDSLTYHTSISLLAAYQRVGLRAVISAYGGRAVLQKLPGDSATGEQAAAALRANGFVGCWVVALGTNDTANVASGAEYSRAQAIDAMMTAIDPGARARILWVNTFTTRTSGSWSNDNMIAWNEELEKAKARWPNLRVFDWASIARTGSAPLLDGIHYTDDGYEARNAAIATAVVELLGSTTKDR
jgi:lysophospholipase L1-like esterase